MSNTVEVTPKPQYKSKQNWVGLAAIVISAFIDKIDAFAPYFMGHEQLVMAVAGIVVIALRQVTDSPVKSIGGGGV